MTKPTLRELRLARKKVCLRIADLIERYVIEEGGWDLDKAREVIAMAMPDSYIEVEAEMTHVLRKPIKPLRGACIGERLRRAVGLPNEGDLLTVLEVAIQRLESR